MIEECAENAPILPVIFSGIVWGASMLASYAISWAFFSRANVQNNAAPMTRDEFGILMGELKSFPAEMSSAQLRAYNSLLTILNSRAPLGILPNEIYRREAIAQIAVEASRLIRENLSFEIIEEIIEEEKDDGIQEQVDDRQSTTGDVRGPGRGDQGLRVEDTISGTKAEFSF